MITYAQNLKSGDIFVFKQKRFTCLMSVTDERHTQTIVATKENVVFRFFRTYPVEVVGSTGDKVKIIEVKSNEITPEMVSALDKLR